MAESFLLTPLKCLTSIRDQQRRQIRLVLGENFGELLKVGDTSATKELKQLDIAVTWLINVDKIVFLMPRDDTADWTSSKLSNKGIIRVNDIQQTNTVNCECTRTSFIERTNVTVFICNICCYNCTIKY